MPGEYRVLEPQGEDLIGSDLSAFLSRVRLSEHTLSLFLTPGRPLCCMFCLVHACVRRIIVSLLP